jgi:hypothetical protein
MTNDNTSLRHASRRLLCVLLTVLGFCWVLFVRPALAQVDQGSITGVVTDSSGKLVPGAKVTLRDVDTGLVLTDKTNGQGTYVFSPVKIGNYTVSAEASGFETTTQENVHLDIQQRLYIPIALKVGKVSESVVVNEAPPLLETETSSVGQVMGTDTINATPLNGRNWVYIAQLTSGVDPGLAAGGARGGGTGDFSANGQRTTQNNFILDGVDNNVNVDDFQNGASYNVRPPPDALAEFKIDTSDYSAEFGHSAGAVLNASIKSGTNQVHGDVWEYVRNTRLDAADWDSAGGAVPAYHENQFGATLGGPIWKNKLFYFGDAEMNRIAFATPLLLSVPTATMRKGDLSEYFLKAKTGKSGPIGLFEPNSAGQVALTGTAGVIANPDPTCVTYSSTCAWNPATPGSGIGAGTTNNYAGSGNAALSGNFNGNGTASPLADPVGLNVLQDYPLPNTGGWTGKASDTPGSGLLYNNYSLNDPIHDNTWQWDQRVDWDLSAKDQSFARYSYTHDQIAAQPPLGPVLDGGYYLPSNGVSAALTLNLAENFMLSETHIFNPNLINEFRFGYNWGHFVIGQENANTPASSLISGLGGVPFTGFAGPNGGTPFILLGGTRRLSYAGSPTDTPSVERQNVYQILDNLTKIHGNHSIKVGIELQSIRTAFSQSQYPRGRYNFNGQYDAKFNAGGTETSLTNEGIADLLTDNMGNIGLSPGWDTQYYRNYRAAYFQDDWKVSSKLTANLGLRYDFIQPASSKGGDLANLVITSQNETGLGLGTSGQSATGVAQWVMPAEVASAYPLSANFQSLLASDFISLNYTTAHQNSLVSVQHYNFAPRIGLAYRYDSKTVVRAAYGLFYGAIEAPGGAELETNYPFAYQVVMDNQYVVQYGGCYPSTQTGAFNINSQCPSNGTPDLDVASGTTPTPGAHPGANQPSGFTPFPYPTSLEQGGSLYFANGGLGAFASASAIAMSQTNIKTPYTQSYNLTIERELMPNMVASLAYVGNNSKHTFAGTDPLAPLAVTSNSNPSGKQGSVAFPGISTENPMETWIGESMYNSLQAKLERRFSGGFSFLASYTWSHAMDDAANPGIGGGPPYRNTNLIPLKDEMTNSNYDVRHRFTFNGLYDLPFGKGRRYVNQGGVLDYFVGGWSASATWQAQTGIPFTVGTGANTFQSAAGLINVNAIRVGDPFKGGGTPPAANIDMQGVTCPATVHNRTNWYNPCAFVDPAPGSSIAPGALLTDEASAIKYGGGKANQIHGPGYERVNMSLFKNFPTWREQYVQFRADAFNLFNTPSLGQPGDQNLDATSGQITNPQSFQNYTPDARFFQLAAKYVF